jgi:hypothetical protein
VVELFEHSTGYAEASVELTAPGPFTLALGAFTAPVGFNWSGIDMIRVFFVDCWRPFGCPSPNPARQYSCGPVTLIASTPTPANRRSWGQLKAVYK